MSIKKVLWSLLFLTSMMVVSAQDTIQLEPYIENIKTVEVYIAGKKYNFLFDTGGAETIISPELANAINKEIYGSVTGYRMSGETIKTQKADSISITIGTTKIFHQTVGVWDLMSILPKDLPRVDGVISLKSFQESILTIELSKNIIIIENKASAKKAITEKSLLTTRFSNGLEGADLNIFVGIPKDNHLYWFLFDSGNSGPFLLSNESAEVWNLKNENYEKSPESEFVLGEKTLKIKPFVRDIIYDGVFNFDAISQYVFTINFKNKEVWFK